MAVEVSLESRCGFCGTGNHENCAIGIKHHGKHEKYKNGIVWACKCTEGGCTPGRRKCADCGNRVTEEVDPDTWTCFDSLACQTVIETRREDNPFLAQLRDIKERVNMAKIENAEKVKAEKAPKVGSCACCGGETKGGNFLPGHDARFVSSIVSTIVEAGFTKKAEDAGRKQLKEAGASEKLTAKFDKSLGLAKEKAEKRAAAEKEKAEAKKAEKANA